MSSGLGAICVLSGLAVLATGPPRGFYGICQVALFVLGFAIVFLALPACAFGLVALWTVHRTHVRGGALAVIGIFGGLVTLYQFPRMLFWPHAQTCGEYPYPPHRVAILSLRITYAAEKDYAETYNAGYSASLKALAPPAAGVQPSADAAGLIPQELVSGKRENYFFAYNPGPRDAAGHVASYTVIARPVTYTSSAKWPPWSFFSDESGVIRCTREDRAATAQDPPFYYDY